MARNRNSLHSSLTARMSVLLFFHHGTLPSTCLWRGWTLRVFRSFSFLYEGSCRAITLHLWFPITSFTVSTSSANFLPKVLRVPNLTVASNQMLPSICIVCTILLNRLFGTARDTHMPYPAFLRLTRFLLWCRQYMHYLTICLCLEIDAERLLCKHNDFDPLCSFLRLLVLLQLWSRTCIGYERPG